LPEELGETGEAEDISPRDIMHIMLSYIPPENQNPLSPREKIVNTICTPFGIAWTLTTIPVILIFEIVCLGICLPFCLVVVTVEVCGGRVDSFADLFVRLGVFISIIPLCMVIALYSFLVFIVQIPLLSYIAMTFCLTVMMQKKRWQSALLVMTRRIIFLSFYHFVMI